MREVKTFDKLDDVIIGQKTIGIAGHVRPDGDCVGSTLAVYEYIKNNYPQADVRIYLEPIPNIFRFLVNASEIRNSCEEEVSFDLFIAEDCGDVARLGQAARYFESAKHTVCIDHHESNQSFAEHNYIFPDASSTCELVYELLPEEKITKNIAECLYTGIVHDTGVFQYSCTSSKTMMIGGKLMDCGIDYSKIIDATFYTKTWTQNKIMGRALLNSELHLEGQVISSILTAEEMRAFGALPKDLEGIVQQLRVTKDVRVAVFLYENEDGSYKVSTRSADDTNLAKLAMKFGGGGHAKAAGFTVHGNPQDALKEILQELENNMRAVDL